jgi:hypothetical protein
LMVDVWGKQQATKILNSKRAVLLISWWGGYLHTVQGGYQRRGARRVRPEFFFCLSPTRNLRWPRSLQRFLIQADSPFMISRRAGPHFRGVTKVTCPRRGVSLEGKHLPHCYGLDGQSAQYNRPCSHDCLCSCGWLIAEQTRWLEISLSALHLRFALLLSRETAVAPIRPGITTFLRSSRAQAEL